jgi:hypothetical protein
MSRRQAFDFLSHQSRSKFDLKSRSATFRQADLSRALKAARAAGMEVGRVEISPDGRIVITPRLTTEQTPAADSLDSWEREYHARKA